MHHSRHHPTRTHSSNRGLHAVGQAPDTSKRTKSSQNSKKPRKKESQKLRAQGAPAAHVVYKTVLRDEQVKTFDGDSLKHNTVLHSQEFERETDAAQFPNPKLVTSPKEMTLTASGPHVGNTQNSLMMTSEQVASMVLSKGEWADHVASAVLSRSSQGSAKALWPRKPS